MMFRQRRLTNEADFEPRSLWQPDELPASVRPVAESDRYVVVDERVDGVIRLAVDDWPQVDQSGRLVFGGRTRAITVNEPDLLDVISRARTELRQEAPNRAIRIGDVFLVGGEPAPAPLEWPARVCDVSQQARSAAKTAFYGAVAPTMAADAVIDHQTEDQGPPPPGPSASPSV